MKQSTALRQLLGERHRHKLPESLTDIAALSTDDMIGRGIGKRDAEKIRAAIALASEIAEPQDRYRIRISSPAMAIRYCLAEFRVLACQAVQAVQEEFWMVSLDTKNQPIRSHMVTRGTLRNSLVHPREVFRPAIADAANCILVVHNHPSGDPEPSDQDISVTNRLDSAAEIIGIPMIDHIIVAGDRAISINEWKAGNR